jgi:murein peptide amidase A
MMVRRLRWGTMIAVALASLVAGAAQSRARPIGDASSAPALDPSRAAYRSALVRRLAPLLRLTSRPCCDGRRHAAALLGRSVDGRPIRVVAWPGAADTSQGANPRAKVLVFGCIHGTECAGRRVVRFINGECPGYTSIWVVANVNPDGFAAGTRVNGRGVDLNRNFPSRWRPIGEPYDLEYSGPHPFSEPETRLAARLIRLIHPRITIWFHQEAQPMVRAWGQSAPVAGDYAKLAGLPFRRLPWLAGTAPDWQNHRFPGTASFVVELPLGTPTTAAARRYGRAVWLVARDAIHPLGR